MPNKFTIILEEYYDTDLFHKISYTKKITGVKVIPKCGSEIRYPIMKEGVLCGNISLLPSHLTIIPLISMNNSIKLEWLCDELSSFINSSKPEYKSELKMGNHFSQKITLYRR